MSGVTTDSISQNGQGRSVNSSDNREGAKSDDIDPEDVFEILSNNRRRRVLSHLRENGATSDIRTLSEHLAAVENNVKPSEVTSKQRMRTYTALRQSHLPKMDRKGAINFDENSGEVSLQAASELERYLNMDLSNEMKWIQYYMGLGIIGLGVSLGLYADIFAFELMPDVLAGLLTSIAIIIASTVHYAFSRS